MFLLQALQNRFVSFRKPFFSIKVLKTTLIIFLLLLGKDRSIATIVKMSQEILKIRNGFTPESMCFIRLRSSKTYPLAPLPIYIFLAWSMSCH